MEIWIESRLNSFRLERRGRTLSGYRRTQWKRVCALTPFISEVNLDEKVPTCGTTGLSLVEVHTTSRLAARLEICRTTRELQRGLMTRGT